MYAGTGSGCLKDPGAALMLGRNGELKSPSRQQISTRDPEGSHTHDPMDMAPGSRVCVFSSRQWLRHGCGGARHGLGGFFSRLGCSPQAPHRSATWLGAAGNCLPCKEGKMPKAPFFLKPRMRRYRVNGEACHLLPSGEKCQQNQNECNEGDEG